MSHDDTRRRLLEAAGAVFAERGFPAATIREICTKAGVNIASVNYHFGDKQGLYAEALHFAHRMRAEQVPLPDWPDDAPAEQRLRDFVATMMRRLIGLQGMPWHWQLMMRELLQPTDAGRGLVEDYIRPHFVVLLSIIDDLVPADTALDVRQKLAFSVVGQCLFYRFHDVVIRMLISENEMETQFTEDALSRHIANMTLASLRSEPLLNERLQEQA